MPQTRDEEHPSVRAPDVRLDLRALGLREGPARRLHRTKVLLIARRGGRGYPAMRSVANTRGRNN
jgi:hypothetical protein